MDGCLDSDVFIAGCFLVDLGVMFSSDFQAVRVEVVFFYEGLDLTWN